MSSSSGSDAASCRYEPSLPLVRASSSADYISAPWRSDQQQQLLAPTLVNADAQAHRCDPFANAVVGKQFATPTPTPSSIFLCASISSLRRVLLFLLYRCSNIIVYMLGWHQQLKLSRGTGNCRKWVQYASAKLEQYKEAELSASPHQEFGTVFPLTYNLPAAPTYSRNDLKCYLLLPITINRKSNLRTLGHVKVKLARANVTL